MGWRACLDQSFAMTAWLGFFLGLTRTLPPPCAVNDHYPPPAVTIADNDVFAVSAVWADEVSSYSYYESKGAVEICIMSSDVVLGSGLSIVFTFEFVPDTVTYASVVLGGFFFLGGGGQCFWESFWLGCATLCVVIVFCHPPASSSLFAFAPSFLSRLDSPPLSPSFSRLPLCRSDDFEPLPMPFFVNVDSTLGFEDTECVEFNLKDDGIFEGGFDAEVGSFVVAETFPSDAGIVFEVDPTPVTLNSTTIC